MRDWMDVTPKPAIAAPELIGFPNNPFEEFRALGKPINNNHLESTFGIGWSTYFIADLYTTFQTCE